MKFQRLACQDWYNGDAEGMKHIGDGINGLNKS